MTETSVALSDRRQLGFVEFGDPEGKPVLCFPGHPGIGIEAKLISDTAERVGVRPIGLDRPGPGLTDFQRGRRMLDWQVRWYSDIGEAGNHRFPELCLTRFAVQSYLPASDPKVAARIVHAQVTQACAVYSPKEDIPYR